MKRWKPVIAACVATALVGITLWDREQTRQVSLDTVRAGRLIPIDVVDATSLTVNNEFGEVKLVKQEDENWQIISPIKAVADIGQVKALIDNFHGAKLMETLEVSDLKPYGLDNPSATVTINGTLDGIEYDRTIEIGSVAGQLGRVYVKYADDDDTIYTTGDWVRNQSYKSLNMLRDRTIFSVARNDVDTIRVSRPNDFFEIQQNPVSITDWTVGSDHPVSGDRLDRFFQLMSSLQAVEMDDEPTTSLASLGLDPPNIRLTFSGPDLEEKEFMVGNPVMEDEIFYVMSSQFEGTARVRGRFIREALYTPTDWQSARLLWRDAAEKGYKEVRSISGTTKTVVSQKDGVWYFPEFEGIPVNPEKWNAILEMAQKAKGFEYVGKDYSDENLRIKFGIRPESFNLIFVTPEDTEEGFVMGSLSENGDYTFVKRIQDNSIWKIDPLELASARFSRKDIQDQRIYTELADQAAKAEVILSTGTTFTIYFEEGYWKFQHPDRPLAIVPTFDVQAYFHAAEEIEWQSELLSSKEMPLDTQFNFYNDDGELFYYIHIYATEMSERLIGTPLGNYIIPEEQLTGLLSAFTNLLSLSQAGSGTATQ